MPSKCNLFSSWYSWSIAELAFNYISLTQSTPELLHVKLVDLPEMFLRGSSRSVTFRATQNPTRLHQPLIGQYIFDLFFQNNFIRSPKTCQNWSFEEVLFFCEVMRNPTWPSWFLIGRGIFLFFSRLDVPHRDPYFSYMNKYKKNYKFNYIHITSILVMF
jgi:hypothetical protein